MGDKTGIQWTDATWNPCVGCSVISPGCTNCYAMKMAARIERMGGPAHYAGLTTPSKKGAVWNGTVRMAPEATLLQPLRWKRPRMIFVNSMSDLFHEAVSDEDIDRVFAVMALCPQHIFQILTKRAERMRDYCQKVDNEPVRDTVRRIAAAWPCKAPVPIGCITFPLPNVWLGVSTEDQPRFDERLTYLRETPAAIRWISAEPLLGAIDGGEAIKHLDWVVVGGESGQNARPMHPDWATGIRDQCSAAGVPFFFKQHGDWAEYSQVGASEWTFTHERDGKRFGFIADEEHGMFGGKSFETRYLSNGSTLGPCMVRVGKKRAGALLDDREWREFPTQEQDHG